MSPWEGLQPTRTAPLHEAIDLYGVRQGNLTASTLVPTQTPWVVLLGSFFQRIELHHKIKLSGFPKVVLTGRPTRAAAADVASHARMLYPLEQ
jgi:hypothetical protein